ncbi:hypothetical protein VCHENC02_0974B, partial [Vibrio harveyi]|jgi:hypothetical protein
VRGD